MKRRDAIKTAIGTVLGFLAAPSVAKAATPETVYLNGISIKTVPTMDGPIGHTHSLNVEGPVVSHNHTVEFSHETS